MCFPMYCSFYFIEKTSAGFMIVYRSGKLAERGL